MSEFVACDYCAGTGIDPYDDDPLGSSMNTPCPKCTRRPRLVNIAALEAKLAASEAGAARLREALEYIVSKAHFVGMPKWDAEFLDVARDALAGKDGET